MSELTPRVRVIAWVRANTQGLGDCLGLVLALSVRISASAQGLGVIA